MIVRKAGLVLALVLLGGAFTAPIAHADTASVTLSNLAYNYNGTAAFTLGGGTIFSGVTESFGGLDANGEGSLVITDTNLGPNTLNAAFQYILNQPFYNDYGKTGGTLAAGQSWRIDSDLNIVTANGSTPNTPSTLNNTNSIPGTTSNYLNNCSGPNCNGRVAMGMGFNYTVTSGNKEVITFSISETAPTAGTFFEEQVQPADTTLGGTTASDITLYLTGTAVEKPNGGGGPPPMPEPSSLSLMGAGLLSLVLLVCAKRFRRPVSLAS